MRAEGELDAAVVRQGLLDRRHLGERRGLGVREAARAAGRPGLARRATCQRAARRVRPKRRERPHRGQALQLVLMQVAAPHQVPGVGERGPWRRSVSIDSAARPRSPRTNRKPRRIAPAGGAVPVRGSRSPSRNSRSSQRQRTSRALHVDRPHVDAVALGVLDQRRRMVEAHRPGVEQPEIEGGRVVRLQVGAGVGDQREARGVRLGEAVEGEGGDRPARSPPAACR